MAMRGRPGTVSSSWLTQAMAPWSRAISRNLGWKWAPLRINRDPGADPPGVAGEAGDALAPVQAVRDGGGQQVLLREQVQVVSQSMDRDGHNRHLRGIYFGKWCAEACGTPRWSVGPAPPWRPRRRRTGGAHWQRRTVRCRPAQRSRRPSSTRSLGKAANFSGSPALPALMSS